MLERMFTLLALSDINTDPLPEANANAGTLETVFNWVFAVTAVIGVLIIIIAGIRFIVSRGDPQKVAQAKNTIVNVAIGLIVMSFAYGLVRVTLTVLGG